MEPFQLGMCNHIWPGLGGFDLQNASLPEYLKQVYPSKGVKKKSHIQGGPSGSLSSSELTLRAGLAGSNAYSLH